MKETIYTIPINEAFEAKCGCPLCTLRRKLERDSVEYIMGAAMMEPDVRIETNKRGFALQLSSQGDLRLSTYVDYGGGYLVTVDQVNDSKGYPP